MAIIKVKKVKNQGWGSNMVKAYEGTITKVGPSLDRNVNYNTGLTKDDEKRLEKALYLKEGSLSSSKENKYWVEKDEGRGYYIMFEGNTPLILDTENPEDELKYLVLKGQKRVAKSVAESNHPTALFVIFNEEDEAAKDNKRGKSKRMAYTLFDSLSPNEMRDILMVYGKPASSSSDDVVENQLQKLLEEDPNLFLLHANDPSKKTKVFILKLVKEGILVKKSGAYFEKGSDEPIAYALDEMIKFLDAKANNAKLLQFKEALKDR